MKRCSTGTSNHTENENEIMNTSNNGDGHEHGSKSETKRARRRINNEKNNGDVTEKNDDAQLKEELGCQSSSSSLGPEGAAVGSNGPLHEHHHHRCDHSHGHSLALESILMNSIPLYSTTGTVTDGTDGADGTSGSSSSSSSGSNNASHAINDFFERVWQRVPVIYKKRKQTNSETKKNHNCTCSSCKQKVDCPREAKCGSKCKCPFQSALMGWDGVANMLEKSRVTFPSSESNSQSHHDDKDDNSNDQSDNDNNTYNNLRPLILQNQTPINDDEQLSSLYSFNPFAAYLDGCSIIVNHADYFSHPLAVLCADLQKSFPHVYCNTYLTPPNSSTVKAHADDRDVIVVQIMGRKKWVVYRDVPVVYPYSYEQVGKNGLVVPSRSSLPSSPSTSTSTSDSPFLMEVVLEEGDVLYMPRGYVHEASTLTASCNNQPSFHATIAIMTSDWSLSKTISDMTRKYLDGKPEYRMAVDVAIGMDGRKSSDHSDSRGSSDIQNGGSTSASISTNAKNKLESELEIIFKQLKECINVETIGLELGRKYDAHNRQAECMRKKFLYNTNYCEAGKKAEGDAYQSAASSSAVCAVVGPKAASLVSMTTAIRASTPEERESIRISNSCHNGTRGLSVREEISEDLLSIAAHLKKNLGSVFFVSELRSLIASREEESGEEQRMDGDIICDFTLCCFVKCCVDLGVMSIVP